MFVDNSINKNTERNSLKIVGFLILIFPSLIVLFGEDAPRLKSKVHQAGCIFRKGLVQFGLDISIVTQLTAFELESSDPFKLLWLLR